MFRHFWSEYVKQLPFKNKNKQQLGLETNNINLIASRLKLKRAVQVFISVVVWLVGWCVRMM